MTQTDVKVLESQHVLQTYKRQPVVFERGDGTRLFDDQGRAYLDFVSGIGKTPFFGFLIAILGCHFGLTTRGGTEGVGRSTTTSVVVVSIGVLVADSILTQLFMSFLSSR